MQVCAASYIQAPIYFVNIHTVLANLFVVQLMLLDAYFECQLLFKIMT